jgi:hypothetical protein
MISKARPRPTKRSREGRAFIQLAPLLTMISTLAPTHPVTTHSQPVLAPRQRASTSQRGTVALEGLAEIADMSR